MDEIPNSPMYVMHQAFLANEGRAQLFLSYVREDIGSPTS
jgi:hypothetical protein